MKLVSRGDTTVVDAYLSPILRRYVDRGRARSARRRRSRDREPPRLQFMQSGGLTDAHRFQGKDAILSGPAGGIVGAVEVSRLAGFDSNHRLRHGRHVDRRHALRRRIRARVRHRSRRRAAARADDAHPHRRRRRRLDLHVRRRALSRRAGVGGRESGTCVVSSRRSADRHRLQRDGRASSIRSSSRKCSGRNGDLPLDADVVREKFAALAAEIAAATGHARTPEEVAAGFLEIAVANMANAIKHISVERGYDVTEYTLCCFGGAGGQHACLVADALGMTRVLLHPFAGVLSAYGMGLADVRALRQQAVEARLAPEALAAAEATFAALERAARDEVAAQGIPEARVTAKRTLHLKYEGTDTTLETGVADVAAIVAEFERRYRQHYGFLMPGKPLVIEAVAVEAVGRTHDARDVDAVVRAAPRTRCGRSRRIASTRTDASTMPPSSIATTSARATRSPGPAVIREDNATTVVEPGWRATFTRSRRPRARARRGRASRARDRHDRGSGPARSVQQPLHGDRRADGRDARQHRLFGQHQGAPRLLVRAVRRRGQPDRQRAAHAGAPGLDGRERADDHRAARRDDAARRCVRAECALQRRHAPAGRDGDRAGVPDDDLSSDAAGTTLGPRAHGDDNRPEFYVASRGHHADIGGITPGSMPPDSTHVDEEGVLLDNVALVAQGRFLEAEMRAILEGGRYPVAQRRAEPRRPPRAGRRVREGRGGARRRWSRTSALPVVRAYMQHVQDNAEESVRRVLDVLKDGHFEYEMDSGARIAVSDRDRQGERARRRRLHRHERAAADQLQRALRRLQGGGALRVPHARRRRDPDERRLPEADPDRDSRRLDARAALSGGGGRRQRRDVAGDHRRALRRARRARGVAGDDEQLHVRQRHATSTTRRSRAAPARGPTSTARPSCRRT